MHAIEALSENRIAVIEAIEAGADSIDELHTPVVGPTSFDAIDYPYVEVLPESVDYQSGNEYAHTVRLNCYFERGRTTDYVTQFAVAMDAAVAAMNHVAGVECVVSYRPQTVEDFAGELDNTLLVLISIQLRITTLVDLADT